MIHDSRAKWVTALAAGSVAGAVAGLMLAPHSGRKLRRKIWNSTENTLHGISAKGGKLFKRCEKITDNVVHFVKRSA
jgi:gas vesicle protein